MLKDKLKFLISIVALILVFFSYKLTYAQPIHLLITEVQISGQTTNDEFIELYNPTNQEIDLTNWSIKKKTKTGNESTLVSSTRFKNKSIPPKKYFLIARAEEYTGTVSPDIYWPKSYSLAKNNTILLYNGEILIDKVGWGNAKDFESSPITNPEDSQSVERKKSDGIYQDTDNNLNDFFISFNPNPQNSSFQTNTQNDEEQETQNEIQENQNSTIKSYAAQPGDIIINEIMPNPNELEREWIELYNKTDYDIDLTGWTIEDNTGDIFGNGRGTQKLDVVSIPAHTYYVLIQGGHFNFRLNNSGDILILKQKNKIIDQVTYGDFEDGNISDNAPAPSKGQSIGRLPNSKNTNNNLNDFVVFNFPTPGKENLEEKQAEKQAQKTDKKPQIETQKIDEDLSLENAEIYLSEILPNPEGSDLKNEWIEIYNAEEEDVNLKNWQIKDESGKNYKIGKDLFIKAKDYLVFTRKETKIALNNNSETVQLISPSKEIVDEIDYEKAVENLSYARDENGNWFWTKILTPGKKNIIKNDEEIKEIEVNDIKKMKNRTKIRIKGVVICPPGILGKHIFYINGGKIFSSKADFPKIELGDNIEIEGTISQSGNKINIKDRNSIKINNKKIKIVAKKITSDSVNENIENYLVEINGRITKKERNKLYLDDGDGEIEVYIKRTTKIKKGEFQKGQDLKVTGILVKNNDNWQILPRYQNDILILNLTKSPVEKESKKLQTASVSSLFKNDPVLKYSSITGLSSLIIIALYLKFKGFIH